MDDNNILPKTPNPSVSADDPILSAQPSVPQANNPTVGAGSSQLNAEDVDVIEKEWVAKAKNIVEQTAHDPYEQVSALNKMRSEYMKKRYNKDIPISKQVTSQ